MLLPSHQPDDLRTTLDNLMASRTHDNAALTALIDSYARYHAAFVVVAGLFIVAFALLALVSWRRLRASPRPAARRWSFERITYLAFTVSAMTAALLMAVLAAANFGNAIDPSGGFSGATSGITTPAAGTRSAQLQQAFLMWLRSGNGRRPAAIDAAIDDRLAWQRPKAIICWVLLVLVVVFAARVWRSLVRRSRAWSGLPPRGDVALLGAGIALGPIALVLMAMVLGNSQASLAPLSMALFFG